MDVLITNYVGLNADTDAIHFGGVSPGNTGKRRLLINNSFGFPIRVILQYYGDIAPWVTASDNSFVLKPGEDMQVKLSVHVPSYIEIPDDYEPIVNGTLKIILRR